MEIKNEQHDSFGYFAGKINKPGKGRCGDSFAVEYFSDENILLLVVADGVSTCPCDWAASEKACRVVTSSFKVCAGTLGARMKAAAEKGHVAVQSLAGPCKGSITSLTFAAWQVGTDEILYTNVGDSRIYSGPEHNLVQITKDDVVRIQIMRDGEPLLNAGVPVFQRGVSRSLGEDASLTFEVNAIPFPVGDTLVLVSDGISKDEAFTTRLYDIYSSNDLQDELKTLIRESSANNKDDATLIFLWRNEDSDACSIDLEDWIASAEDFRTHGASSRLVRQRLADLAFAALDKNDNAAFGSLIEYSNRFRVPMDLSKLEELLSLSIKAENKPVVDMLRRQITKRM